MCLKYRKTLLRFFRTNSKPSRLSIHRKKIISHNMYIYNTFSKFYLDIQSSTSLNIILTIGLKGLLYRERSLAFFHCVWANEPAESTVLIPLVLQAYEVCQKVRKKCHAILYIFCSTAQSHAYWHTSSGCRAKEVEVTGLSGLVAHLWRIGFLLEILRYLFLKTFSRCLGRGKIDEYPEQKREKY